MFKSSLFSIVDPTIEKLSQEIILDYVEDDDSDENEDTDGEVGDYDTEDVVEDDDDENNNAQTA
jgi:hypothetical protein